MNKKILFALIVGSLTLAGCGQSNTENTASGFPSIIKGSIEEINEDWNKYENEELGFSVEYPKINFIPNQPEYNVVVIEAENIESEKAIYLDNGQYKEEIDQKKELSGTERVSGIPFAFLIQEVKNDEELESFIKERYGKNCKLGEKEPSGKEGVYNVNVDGLTSPGDLDGCLINYITHIKYSPEKGKVATWDVGQDANFYEKDGTPVDDQITESFEFL